MSNTNKERYIQNAKDIIEMLEAEPDFIPVMRDYCSVGLKMEYLVKNECGTSYCLAGKQAQLDGFPGEFITLSGEFDFRSYSMYKCGYSLNDRKWNFLYNFNWLDSREHAIKRCQYIIDNEGDVPDNLDWEKEWNYPLI